MRLSVLPNKFKIIYQVKEADVYIMHNSADDIYSWIL